MTVPSGGRTDNDRRSVRFSYRLMSTKNQNDPLRIFNF